MKRKMIQISRMLPPSDNPETPEIRKSWFPVTSSSLETPQTLFSFSTWNKCDLNLFSLTLFGEGAIWPFGNLAIWQVSTLAIRQFGNFALWQVGKIALCYLGTLASLQFGDLTIRAVGKFGKFYSNVIV